MCSENRAGFVKSVKVRFFRKTFTYLGHVIKPGRLENESCAFKSLKEALPPQNKLELRPFLRWCNVHRRFVHYLEKIAGPLNVIFQKEAPEVIKDLIRSS